MSWFRVSLPLLVLLPALAVADDVLTIAVASNFQKTASTIAARFTEVSGIEVRISTGSTGKLYAQIVNGAPYDVFLAADTERPQKLVDNEFASADHYFIYATGYLVLWSNHPGLKNRDCAADLRAGDYRYLAIANPDVAPYGAVARDVLVTAGLWEERREKIVYGENVSQVFQFVASGSATMGLVATSQIVGDIPFETTCLSALPGSPGAHSIRQAGVVLANSKYPQAATKFRAFLLSPAARSVVAEHGYGKPDFGSIGR